MTAPVQAPVLFGANQLFVCVCTVPETVMRRAIELMRRASQISNVSSINKLAVTAVPYFWRKQQQLTRASSGGCRQQGSKAARLAACSEHASGRRNNAVPRRWHAPSRTQVAGQRQARGARTAG